MIPTIKTNIRALLCDRFVSGFWLFSPILVPFYQSNGLSVTQVFVIQAVFSIAVCILEVPTGYLSDVMGRRKTLIMASFLLSAGVVIYAFSRGFWGFVLGEVVVAVGMSMRSGTDSSMLYDTLIELKQEKKYNHYEGTGHFLERLGNSFSAILGGFISVISLRLPFYINIATSLLLLPIALSVKEPARKLLKNKTARDHLAELVKAVKYCAHHSDVRNAIIYSAMLTSSGIAGMWSYYLYFESIGINVGFFGILAASFGLISGAGGKLSGFIERKAGEAFSLFLPLMIAPGFALLGFIRSAYALPFIFLNAFLWGAAAPMLKGIVHKHTSSSIRATVLSVMGLAGRLGFAVISVMVGKIVDLYSLKTAYEILGAIFLMVTLPVAVSLLHKPEKNDMAT